MIRRVWDTATFGAPNAGRRTAILAGLGAVAGLGETLVVFLIIAMVSGSEFSSVPLGDQLPSGTGALAATAVAAVAVLAAVHFATARIAASSTAEAQATLQRRLARAFLRAPWQAQAGSPPGELQDLATMKASLLGYSVQQAALAMAALVNLVVVLLAALAVSPLAALALLATVALVLGLTRPVRARRLAIIERYRTSTTDLAVEVTETASVSRDVRIFGVTDPAFDRLDTSISASAEQTRALQFVSMATGPLTRDATLVVLVIALALLVSGSDVALPALATTVVLLLRVLAHAQSLTGFVTHLDELALNVAALRRTLVAWEEDEPRGDQPCPRVDRLALREVSFAYPGRERPAVQGATLELERGEMLGIVGRTGAGKSTLASLLLGLLHATSGAVTADDRPLEDLDPADWHARTAWVGQEPRLLAGTVADNIRFLRDDLTDAQIARAAQRAGLGLEVSAWPDGLAHRVGPAGAALSGGERQRVALARALAGDPDLLVLDEPTSSLDAHTEEAVRAAIAEARADRIVVVIAHRLSTLRACDRIAVVVDGRIEAVEPPAQLEASNRYYREALAASRP